MLENCFKYKIIPMCTQGPSVKDGPCRSGHNEAFPSGSMTQAPFRHIVPIRFQDCDPAGIVYYPRFIDMVEAAIEDWMDQALGEPYRNWIGVEGRALPRVKVTCDFKKPCRMGDRLELTVLLRKFGNSSMEVETVGQVAGEERLRVSIVLVNMSLESRKAVPFAASFREKLKLYQSLSSNRA